MMLKLVPADEQPDNRQVLFISENTVRTTVPHSLERSIHSGLEAV